MDIKNLNNTAFSLLEVLLAAIIFIVSVAGVFVTMNAVRGPVANKENQLAATVFAKQVLEALYSQVADSSYYTTSCVNSAGSSLVNPDGSCGAFSFYISASAPYGLHEVANAQLPSGLTWPANTALTGCNNYLSYTVSCADGSPGPTCNDNPNVGRRVDLNVIWLNAITGTCS